MTYLRLFGSQNVVTGSRSAGTTYQNTSKKPMLVTVTATAGASNGYVQAKTDGSSPPTTIVVKTAIMTANTEIEAVTFIVLPGNYYLVEVSNVTITYWIEWI